MALSTARMHKVRGRPPLLAAGISSLILSHSSSVRSLGYVCSFIFPFYTTHEDFSDRLSGDWIVSPPVCATGLSLMAKGCLIGATPRAQRAERAADGGVVSVSRALSVAPRAPGITAQRVARCDP